ncbi:ComEC/Rec2 family competence protein [Pseudomonas syringae]|uniref:ComEC/Rec2 family competence protein n=1 Tax=Pseudomonas syringae TaxID=317 RepID=UPI001268A38D|nr:MBL fold metallo-hydrolase [Pseudomonas syringae]
MLEISMLPANEGDALWIRWGDLSRPHQMLVDMGSMKTGNLIYDKIKSLAPERRKFELIVVTHIDSDHIGGVISCFIKRPALADLEVKDIWFNGFEHLDSTAPDFNTESLGACQANEMSRWLRVSGNWNLAFKGGAVVAPHNAPFPSVELLGGMKVTVLGPSCQRLDQLKPVWANQLLKALSSKSPVEPDDGIEPMGSEEAPDTLFQLEKLAKMPELSDTSIPNSSSIVLMLEYSGRRVILTGDAWADDLLQMIQTLNTEGCLLVDAFKVPHHASRFNITESLVKSLDCKNWLISTNGSRHHHPDNEAIAKIIHYSNLQPAKLSFNVRSKWNDHWCLAARQASLDYTAIHGNDLVGLSVDVKRDP